MGATQAGTASFFEKLLSPSSSSQNLLFGRTGWTVSPVGFGCYRVEEEDPNHRAALRLALGSGCNLIDTSTNYTNGSSERLVGQVLRELFDTRERTRDEIVVVTKVGYVQGENLELARIRESEGHAFPKIVKYGDGIWHCISPEFLDDQITRSLSRLAIDQIDLLLLHNPEYFLKSGGDHAEYYCRIKAALEYLETEIRRGRIQKYGISSNTFVDPKESPEYTSLETILDFAGPGFAAIQFPMNLFEPGAQFEPNNTGKSVCELAASRGLGTLVNRPLNAFTRERMIRLADFSVSKETDVEEDLKNAFIPALELESRYPARDQVPAKNVAWAHLLRDNLDRVNELDLWRQVLRYQIQPVLRDSYSRLLRLGGEAKAWAEEHPARVDALFGAFTRFLEHRHSIESNRIREILEKTCPEIRRSHQTLSQASLRVYRSLPGIQVVLVGMRQPEYVRDALQLLPPLSAEEATDAFDAILEFEVKKQT